MELQENTIDNQEVDTLSVKDFVNGFLSLYIFAVRNFIILFLFGLIGGAVGFYIAYKSKPQYPAKIKFIMKETGGNSSLISSLGSLGSLIGGGPSTASPMNRTLAILGSERIVGSVLLKPIKINNKNDIAINHLIEVFELRNNWGKDSLLSKVEFSINETDLDSFHVKQRLAYKKVLGMFLSEKSTILNKSFDKLSGVFESNIITPNEELSIAFSKLLYNELEQFLYNQSITSSGKNISILKDKVDSIKFALNNVQNSLARNSDRTLGLLMQEDKVDQKKLLLKEQMLTIMYGEAQKNLEAFKFVNESINPGLEILEYPINPISPIKKNKIKYSLLGFLITSISIFGILITRKWFKSQL